MLHKIFFFQIPLEYRVIDLFVVQMQQESLRLNDLFIFKKLKKNIRPLYNIKCKFKQKIAKKNNIFLKLICTIYNYCKNYA